MVRPKIFFSFQNSAEGNYQKKRKVSATTETSVTLAMQINTTYTLSIQLHFMKF